MMSEELIPLAWLYEHKADASEMFMQLNRANMDSRYWREEPLYTFEQLQGFNRLVDHPPTSNPVDDRGSGNTSDKLRDALEVWRDAYDAFTDFYHHTTEKDPARVIEADREAVRAALVAEICEWLRDGAGIGASLAHPSVLQAIEAKWGTPTHS